jgi:hypothetical protein
MKPLPRRDLDRFRRRVDHWARRLGVAPSCVIVMRMRRKWASCAASGRVMFSCDALLLTPRLRDYVIVHELLHLRIRNHGPLFKAQLSSHLPDWKRRHTHLGRSSPGLAAGPRPGQSFHAL